MQIPLLVAVSSLFSLATAHGRVTNITASDGTVYQGWDPESANSTSPPRLAAWSASNLGNIYVRPSQFNTSSIACHYNAVPGALHVNTSAGGTLKLQWNEWPTSHVGPVMTYLAACSGSCAAADKNTLQWVKIDEQGWLNSTNWDKLNLGGTWATNVLIANGFSWRVKLPEVLAAGNYVLRHEIIALHVADKPNGAQAYPQCINLRVAKGTSTQVHKLGDGSVGHRLYGANDAGIFVDVHKKLTGYDIPGPKLWTAAESFRQPNQRKR
ncbi:hypothetical protein ACN47E_009039 [Coniothyrium glycines]